MLGSDHREELEDGRVLLYIRNGIFQARIYVGDRGYLYRSLKTSDIALARREAVRVFNVTQYKQQEGLPLTSITMSQLIDEYVKLRQDQYDKSQEGKKEKTTNANNKNSTSIYMLRQIKRVVKFWREYCGNSTLDKVDDGVLRAYVDWRKNYYHRIAVDSRPRNCKLNPTDKTLLWELTLCKTMLKYAQERGYRGKTQLPTYTMKGVKKIVRPAFTMPDYISLVRGMRKWIREATNERELHPRLLLRDYVLILANSGMRVGEANNLQWRDVIEFKDERGRKNYMLNVKGKTGKRMVVPKTNSVRFIERLMGRYPDREQDDYIFKMKNGSRVITLIDQFQNVLKRAGISENSHGERYTLYSLRHWYAVRALSAKKRIPVFDLARNMGTSVVIIEQYYGRHTTSSELATKLGG